MERTVPKTATEEIDLYLKTIYSLLRSTTEIQIRTLEEVHAGMVSLLHPKARGIEPDISAFIYSLLRLPECMPDVNVVILGQSAAVFDQNSIFHVEDWQQVSAPARRRRCFYDGNGRLACFIASRSDIEDVLPVMTAYQIEWNKFNLLLQGIPNNFDFNLILSDIKAFEKFAEWLKISFEDLERLQIIWGENFIPIIKRMKKQKCAFRINLLGGPLSEYWRATRSWWENIEEQFPEILNRPVYFVSSNTHSLVNTLSGFALKNKESIIEFLSDPKNANLKEEWNQIINGNEFASIENFLYYALKKAKQSESGRYLKALQYEDEKKKGITRVVSTHYFDVDAQVIELNKLELDDIDPRIKELPGIEILNKSNALILNIDYPLGLAAYNILTKIAEHVNPVLGVYIMGKGATLNGVYGDIMIS